MQGQCRLVAAFAPRAADDIPKHLRCHAIDLEHVFREGLVVSQASDTLHSEYQQPQLYSAMYNVVACAIQEARA